MPWRDYRDLFRQMEYDMQRFSEEALRAFLESPGPLSRFWQPAADIHETQSGIVIKLELAGVTTETVHVSFSSDGRQLTVSGTRAETENEREARTGCRQLEIYFGPFERTFDIPGDTEIERDGITATLRNGFLTVYLPRRQPTPAVRRTISIGSPPVEAEEGGDR